MDEKLALVKKFMELGGDVELTITSIDLSKNEALALIEEVSTVTGEKYHISTSRNYQWFRVSPTLETRFGASVFHEESNAVTYEL